MSVLPISHSAARQTLTVHKTSYTTATALRSTADVQVVAGGGAGVEASARDQTQTEINERKDDER